MDIRPHRNNGEHGLRVNRDYLVRIINHWRKNGNPKQPAPPEELLARMTTLTAGSPRSSTESLDPPPVTVPATPIGIATDSRNGVYFTVFFAACLTHRVRVLATYRRDDIDLRSLASSVPSLPSDAGSIIEEYH